MLQPGPELFYGSGCDAGMTYLSQCKYIAGLMWFPVQSVFVFHQQFN